MNKSLFLAACAVLGFNVYALAPRALSPYEVVVPSLNGDPSSGDRVVGQMYYDITTNLFKGVNGSGGITSLAGGANTALSNLASTAVNADILPDSNNSRNLGNQSGYQFNSVNARQGVFAGGNILVSDGSNTSLVKAHAFGDLSKPRVLFLDVNPIDPMQRSRISLVSTDGADIELATLNGSGVIATPNHVRSFYHPVQPATSASPTANAGSTGTCNLANATDVAGQITITTDGSGIASGAVCDVTFGQSYAAAPICTVTPANALAGVNAQQMYMTRSTSALTVNFNVAGGSAETYVYHYHCIEVHSF